MNLFDILVLKGGCLGGDRTGATEGWGEHWWGGSIKANHT